MNRSSKRTDWERGKKAKRGAHVHDNFSWVLQSSQEKSTTMAMQFFFLGGGGGKQGALI